jgi:hypothetical protein
MSSKNPSWNWLPPRPSTREMAERGGATAAPQSRPCLPAIEPLDDRILLSAAPAAAVDQPGGTTANTGILIGLLKGQLDLIKGEIATLKLAAGGETQIKGESVIKLLTNEFLKLDETVLKLGDAAVIGDLAGYKEQQIKIDQALNKLDALLPDSSSLLPAVQRLVKSLTPVTEGGQAVSYKEQKVLLKIADEFLKIDGAILKFAADPTGAEFQKGLDPSIKFLKDVVKIDALVDQLDPQIKGELTEALNAIKVGTLDFLGSLLKPVDNGGLSSDGPFDGGVTLPDDTGGDVLA